MVERKATRRALGLVTDQSEPLNNFYRHALVAHPSVEVQRNYFKRIFDEAPAPYIVTNPGLVILDANHTAQDMLGRNLPALRGKPLSLLVSSAERPIFRAIAAELVSSRKLSRPLCIQRNGGGETDVVCSAAVVHSESGHPELIFWVFQDRAPVDPIDLL